MRKVFGVLVLVMGIVAVSGFVAGGVYASECLGTYSYETWTDEFGGYCDPTDITNQSCSDGTTQTNCLNRSAPNGCAITSNNCTWHVCGAVGQECCTTGDPCPGTGVCNASTGRCANPTPTPTTVSCTNTCTTLGVKQCIDATSQVRECRMVGACRQWVDVYSCALGCNEAGTDCAYPNYCRNIDCSPDPADCSGGSSGNTLVYCWENEGQFNTWEADTVVPYEPAPLVDDICVDTSGCGGPGLCPDPPTPTPPGCEPLCHPATVSCDPVVPSSPCPPASYPARTVKWTDNCRGIDCREPIAPGDPCGTGGGPSPTPVPGCTPSCASWTDMYLESCNSSALYGTVPRPAACLTND